MRKFMKLSNDTLTILKNFAGINSGIEFKIGDSLATMSPGKTILAKAKLKDTFPDTFCVFDLNQFLSVLFLGIRYFLRPFTNNLFYFSIKRFFILAHKDDTSLTDPKFCSIIFLA